MSETRFSLSPVVGEQMDPGPLVKLIHCSGHNSHCGNMHKNMLRAVDDESVTGGVMRLR